MRNTVAIVALVLALLVGGSLPAHSHSFFDVYCCSGKDCSPAPLGSVKWSPAGWKVSTPTVQDTVPFDDKRIRYVPHAELQQFYICEWPVHRLRCLYVSESAG